MSVSAKADLDDRAKIAAVREEWIQAVNKSDVDRMLTLVTDDVVAIHGDGRCQRGKEELKAGLLHITTAYDAERKVLSSELILRDKWAFQLDDMDSSVTPVRGGREIRAHLRTVLVYVRQQHGRGRSRGYRTAGRPLLRKIEVLIASIGETVDGSTLFLRVRTNLCAWPIHVANFPVFMLFARRYVQVNHRSGLGLFASFRPALSLAMGMFPTIRTVLMRG